MDHHFCSISIFLILFFRLVETFAAWIQANNSGKRKDLFTIHFQLKWPIKNQSIETNEFIFFSIKATYLLTFD